MPGEKDHRSPEAEPLLALATNDPSSLVEEAKSTATALSASSSPSSSSLSKNIKQKTAKCDDSKSKQFIRNETCDDFILPSLKLQENNRKKPPTQLISLENSFHQQDKQSETQSPKSKSLKSSLNSPNSIDKPTKQLLFEVAEETSSMNNEMNDGTTSNNRFKVAKVDGNDESSDERQDESDSEADNRSLQAHIYATAGYDTKNLKSFKHYTREALPRVDNYRNIMSIHGYSERPTLDDLLGVQTTVQYDSKTRSLTRRFVPTDQSKQVKFGWVEGVLVRCLLNIWGVILFIRLSWVAGEAGIFYGIMTILLASLCTFITTISMSAICTNGEVKGGGTYYMISRSLGPEFGGAIGVIFSLANAVAVAMYSIGFAETVRDVIASYGTSIIDNGLNDIRLISSTTVVILLIICFIGTQWESKTQIILLVILLSAMVNFLIGSLIPPTLDNVSKGYVGWNGKLFWNNLFPAYTKNENFISVFGVYFPAATGILAGANISGDLKDPSKSIPKGTFLSIFITTIVYIVILIVVNMNVMRNANGVVELLENVTTITPEVMEIIADCSLASNGTCKFGTLNYFQVIEMISLFGPLIYAGIFAAALSSALASLVSAPKVFQALCSDKLLPGLEYFSVGSGPSNDPKRGFILSFVIAFSCCMIGELNAIAPIISNFFLSAYMLINFASFHADFSKSTGFRPSFRYYNKWASLIGSIFCFIIMMVMNWFASALTCIIIFALYLWIQERKPEVNWGSSTQAQNYRSAIQSVYRLNLIPDHAKTYRPQILLLSGNPGTHSAFVDLANTIIKSSGMLICGNIITSTISHRAQNVILQDSNLWLFQRKVKAFVNLVQEDSFLAGVRSMLQNIGIGKLRPNIVMLGFKNDWLNSSQGDLIEYFKTIHLVFDRHLSLVIVSIPEHCAVANIGNGNGAAKKECAIDLAADSTESSGIDFNRLNLTQQPSIFQIKQKQGFIDVWWLYDDGGLTLLLPYLISINKLWKDSKLRIFALVNKKSELDTEQRNMAALLSKFRINFSDVILITTLLKPPTDETKQEFQQIINKFVVDDNQESETVNDEGNYDFNQTLITESDLLSFKDKNYRHMRIRELLQENSKDSNLVVMTLPLPRKNQCPAPIYMAWLELLTKDMPPMMLIRGNQTNVLTFYS